MPDDSSDITQGRARGTVSLPDSGLSPWWRLTIRMLLALTVLTVTVGIVYLDRHAYRDANDPPLTGRSERVPVDVGTGRIGDQTRPEGDTIEVPVHQVTINRGATMKLPKEVPEHEIAILLSTDLQVKHPLAPLLRRPEPVDARHRCDNDHVAASKERRRRRQP